MNDKKKVLSMFVHSEFHRQLKTFCSGRNLSMTKFVCETIINRMSQLNTKDKEEDGKD